MSFYRPFKKFARLNGAEKRLLCLSGFLTAGLRLFLRILPFRKTLEGVRRFAAGRRAAAHRRLSSERITWAVRAAGRRLAAKDRPCLTQALVLFILFRRHGHPADLHIGVLKDDEGQLRAHAWVESDERVVIGRLPNLPSYTALPSLEL